MRPAAADIERALIGLIDARVAEELLGVVARVSLADVVDALEALKVAGYESLVDFDGIDTGELIELTYRLRSYTLDLEVYVKAPVAYAGTIASIWHEYPSALMPERETAELFGLHLAGHPNPKRLLTTDGVAPLLRKDVLIRTVEEVRDR
ncbi:MAG: NADH-quinone oxidoreductase subunit C [Actinomycetota bacterium]|nr:NADH-quinone oxidoreductase subunit C [Actinomycetota bacterium]MDP3629737.1 NADH-quinone oxidoreductase subunit C [Actinomycetota bacterium]